MNPGEINDLGYGVCYKCRSFKELTHFDPRSKGKKRKERKRCCAKCANEIKTTIEPFVLIRKAISSHKAIAGEGDYTFSDIMRLHSLQGGKCAYCPDPIPYGFTIEHIIPRKFGGRNLLFNILLICSKCNSQKQHFELVYWLEKKKYKVAQHIYKKVREAYDRHEYEFKGTCSHCRGTDKTDRTYCDTRCTSTAKTRAKVVVQSQQVRPVQAGKTSSSSARNNAIRSGVA